MTEILPLTSVWTLSLSVRAAVEESYPSFVVYVYFKITTVSTTFCGT